MRDALVCQAIDSLDTRGRIHEWGPYVGGGTYTSQLPSFYSHGPTLRDYLDQINASGNPLEILSLQSSFLKQYRLNDLLTTLL